jgi:hypothetical protein
LLAARSSWTSSTCSSYSCRSSAAATTSWRSRGSHDASAPADRAVPSALEAV